MAAFATKNNSAYAGATRLQGAIDSFDEDSTLVNLCAVDDRALISEVINDSSRVNTGIDETSTSIMETSGGLFNLTPEPRRRPPMMMEQALTRRGSITTAKVPSSAVERPSW